MLAFASDAINPCYLKQHKARSLLGSGWSRPPEKGGIVEGLRFLSSIDLPDLLEVRAGSLGRQLLLIPVEQVEGVLFTDGRLLVGDTPRLEATRSTGFSTAYANGGPNNRRLIPAPVSPAGAGGARAGNATPWPRRRRPRHARMSIASTGKPGRARRLLLVLLGEQAKRPLGLISTVEHPRPARSLTHQSRPQSSSYRSTRTVRSGRSRAFSTRRSLGDRFGFASTPECSLWPRCVCRASHQSRVGRIDRARIRLV
jgi:hypothetical protein